MRLTIIGWYLLCLLVAALLVLTMSGCCQRTYEHIVRDTVTVTKVDSVIVQMREVDVEVPVPQIHLEQWVAMDSISILDNGLYVSVVEVVNGQIHHTLKPVEGATVDATVHVSDTTHIHHNTTNTVHVEKETTTVKEEESWWDRLTKKLSWTVIVVLATVLLVLGVLWRFRSKLF